MANDSLGNVGYYTPTTPGAAAGSWEGPQQSVPQQRIIEKLDDYMGRRDYAGAERHLLYWLQEALALGDQRGELMVRNELVGHFRKTANREQAFAQIAEALRLVDQLGFGETISAGTTYTNAATACNAFGENERALALFQKAAALYEQSSFTKPALLGGLYNNTALACISLGRFDEADGLYAKALATMEKVEGGQLEQAITYLNMADAAVAREMAARKGAEPACVDAAVPTSDAAVRAASEPGPPTSADGAAADDVLFEALAACEGKVEACLDIALDLLDAPSAPRDGYYAFVCEKCAPVFAHYGYFLAAGDLRSRAQAIYGRARGDEDAR